MMRGTSRQRAAIGALLAICPLLVPLATSCATPTAIILDLSTDACGQIKQTAVLAAAKGDLEPTASPVAVKDTCDDDHRIGSLTLVPSASKSAAVDVMVMAIVSGTVDDCVANATGCIVARRTVGFVSGQTVHVGITLAIQCQGFTCKPDETCVTEKGGPECKPVSNVENTPPDSTTQPVADSGPIGPAATDAGPADAGKDASPPTVFDCGTGCPHNGTCTANHACAIACTPSDPCMGSMCPQGYTCAIDCQGGNSCPSVQCDNVKNSGGSGGGGGGSGGGSRDDTSCTFRCAGSTTGNGPFACGTVACNGTGSCQIDCVGSNACGVTQMSGGTSVQTCTGTDSCKDSSSATCSGQHCTLQCVDPNCPGTTDCSGDCKGRFGT